MDAYMICDLGNPLSVAYTKVSLDTWTAVESVNVQRVQCVTPDTLDSSEYFSQLDWADHLRRPWKLSSQVRYFTPSEKSCFMTMFDLWVKQSESSERFMILEHDAYVRNPEKLQALMKRIDDYDLWLPGIALETVCMSQRFAMEFVNSLLSGYKVDMGPMALMLEFFDKYYSKPDKKRLWPSNFQPDPSKPPIKNLLATNDKGVESAPVTQCIYLKGYETVNQLGVNQTYDAGCSTIDHTTAISATDNMEILDSLPLDE